MGNDQEAARGWMGAGEDGDGIAFHSPAEVCLAPAAAMRAYLPAVAPHVQDACAEYCGARVTFRTTPVHPRSLTYDDADRPMHALVPSCSRLLLTGASGTHGPLQKTRVTRGACVRIQSAVCFASIPSRTTPGVRSRCLLPHTSARTGWWGSRGLTAARDCPRTLGCGCACCGSGFRSGWRRSPGSAL